MVAIELQMSECNIGPLTVVTQNLGVVSQSPKEPLLFFYFLMLRSR